MIARGDKIKIVDHRLDNLGQPEYGIIEVTITDINAYGFGDGDRDQLRFPILGEEKNGHSHTIFSDEIWVEPDLDGMVEV